MVENGVGYDNYMEKIEAASPSSSRKVIDVQHLLGLPDSTPNPHLWYKPDDDAARSPGRWSATSRPCSPSTPPTSKPTRGSSTVPEAVAGGPAKFKARYPETPSRRTEPVGDYMLEAAGVEEPDPLQHAGGHHERHRSGAPERDLPAGPVLRAPGEGFVYNQQVTDSLTQSFLEAAAKRAIPVVGVYETMPAGYRYNRGCSPRSGPWNGPSHGGSRPRSFKRRRDSVSQDILSVQELGVRLSGRQILDRVSFSVAPGEFTGLIGSNGTGKTTLFRAILGLQALSEGRVLIGGRPRSRRNAQIGYVPQKFLLDPDLPMRARDLVGLGLDANRLGLPLPSRTRRALVEQMLAAVDADRFADTRVGRLSGGEQQRILIAHALIARPRLLLLDEPLANLDLGSADEVVALLARVAREQEIAVLISAHEMNPLLPVMDRIVYLAAGRAASGTDRSGRAGRRAQRALWPPCRRPQRPRPRADRRRCRRGLRPRRPRGDRPGAGIAS